LFLGAKHVAINFSDYITYNSIAPRLNQTKQ